MLETVVDIDRNMCQSDVITAPVPETGTDAPCMLVPGACVQKTKRGGPRPGSGRPKITSERPWDAEGICRRTYDRRLKPTTHTQISYAIDTPVWCVVAFHGQAERSAITSLSQEGYETYLPMTAIRRQDPVVKSMWHTVRIPYFAGYGFIRLTQSESREPIQAIRGVREILRRPDGRAASVPDALIEKLIEDAPRRLELPKEHGPVLDVGAKVLIKDGTFGGHRGVVSECDGVNTKVEVELFGRPVPIWMDRVSVEVVS